MRKNAREAVFKITFATLFHDDCPNAFRAAMYRQEKLDESDRAYAEVLYGLVQEHREELSSAISARIQRFADYRIYPVDKAIMLVALAEIRYYDEVPPVVSVSEAAALARKYSTENSADFVNGVLGGIINE
ncbi:MAG: transcription antitermination factor NusB [Clostridia bacterium]|nr:transcription antitermination factor NusB [Clostridia bacterium]